MSRLAALRPALVALSATCLLSSILLADDRPEAAPLAHFRFDGNARDAHRGRPGFQLKNTEFHENALYLNGRYEFDREPGGYSAIGKTPKLDYDAYTVAFRFKAQEFGPSKTNLITGGTSYRWFGLERSSSGKLLVTFNNGEFRKEIEKSEIDPGQWTRVACSVSVERRKVLVRVNDGDVATIDLPDDFKVVVTSSKARQTDKVWTFTNRSNGNCFHGLVDELIIYGHAMSAEELKKIPLRP